MVDWRVVMKRFCVHFVLICVLSSHNPYITHLLNSRLPLLSLTFQRRTDEVFEEQRLGGTNTLGLAADECVFHVMLTEEFSSAIKGEQTGGATRSA
jgi:hypothetical protein